MTKRAIPKVPPANAPRHQFDQAIKENIEVITGRAATPIRPLASTATLEEVIAKVNEVIQRLQE